jgi:hypothetical protein
MPKPFTPNQELTNSELIYEYHPYGSYVSDGIAYDKYGQELEVYSPAEILDQTLSFFDPPIERNDQGLWVVTHEPLEPPSGHCF